MHKSPIRLPDAPTLTHRFNALLLGDHAPGDRVTILAREPNPRTSTYVSEVVTCQLADGSELQVLCKYAGGRNHNAYGHRGGVTYEAEVYRQVLQHLPVTTPTFYGADEGEMAGEGWFVLEYLDQSLRIKDSRDRTLMHAAARWLGRFHRANTARFSPASMPFLHTHDADYYLGWATRTSQFAGHLHQRFAWLAPLCKRFATIVDTLLEPPAIIIHGEYYPGNILSSQGTIYPVDWESAAVAMGEIDLASLNEGWPAHTVERCITDYQAARWPEGTPVDFERRLDVVQFYWIFRWLGERPDWTHQEKALKRFERLRSLGERWGLI